MLDRSVSIFDEHPALSEWFEAIVPEATKTRAGIVLLGLRQMELAGLITAETADEASRKVAEKATAAGVVIKDRDLAVLLSEFGISVPHQEAYHQASEMTENKFAVARNMMKRGDHIFVKRFGYHHHGIYCGGDEVIHFSGTPSAKSNAEVCVTTLAKFARRAKVRVKEYSVCDAPSVVIRRAKSRLGKRDYSLFLNNCEHFATWCKTGRAGSEQVRRSVAGAGGAVSGTAATAASLAVVSAKGVVAGLSGPGIMSGLATVGGVAGGGAIAGIAVLGATPAALATGAMMYALKDDEHASAEERFARRAGRGATVVGAAGGMGAAVSAVAASGTAAGLSGAGITSGLAAIGGVVGGGMAAGVVATVAAPAVVAAALGAGVYALCKIVYS